MFYRTLWLVCGYGVVLSQTAGVWHWHHHSTTGRATPTVGWIGENGPNFRSILGKVVVMGDTVYTLGTASYTNPLDSLALPNGGPPISLNAPGTSAYIAAYNRQTGAFIWVTHFFPQPAGGSAIRGVELLVDESHTVYAILHGQATGGLGSLAAAYATDQNPLFNPATITGNSTLDNYPLSFIARLHPSNLGDVTVLRLGCGRTSFTAPLCDGSNFEANFFSLLLHEGKLWASGTVKTNRAASGSTYLNPSGIGSPGLLTGLLNLVLGLLTEGINLQATLLRIDPASLSVDSASVVQSSVSLGSHPACYGRALFAYGPDTVGWVVALREQGNKRYRVVGSSSGTALGDQPSLRVLLIRASTMGLHVFSAFNNLAMYATPPNPIPQSAPPHYYVAFQRTGSSGGELFWAVSDTAWYFLPFVGTFTRSDGPRLILCRALLSSNGLTGHRAVFSAPIGTNVQNLTLTGLSIEPQMGPIGPEPHLYLSGTIRTQSWTLQGLAGGGSVTLPASPIGAEAGFILGVRWKGVQWRFQGYKPLYSLATEPLRHLVVSAGMAQHPTLPQLYLYGWALDSVLVEPRWSSGAADTIRPVNSSNQPPRLWIGRLDLYRIKHGTSALPFSLCTPDTTHFSEPVIITGTWAPSIQRELVWVPADRPYWAQHAWARITANPIGPTSAFEEGAVSANLPLIAPGRLPPGRYFLALRSPVMRNRFADITDTVWLYAGGTTIPFLQRAGALRWNRMVVRYAGEGPASGFLPPASTATQPFYRKERRFESIHRLVYLPWEAWTGGREAIYLLEALANSYKLYRLDLSTGLFTPLRSWPVSGSGSRGASLFGDGVRGALWSVSENRVFWRLDTADAAKDDSLLLYRAGATFSATGVTHTGGYPIGSSQRWLDQVRSPTCTSNGDLVFFGQHWVTSTDSRWIIARIAPERDSIHLVVGGGNSPCPQDGVGGAATLSGDFSRITSWGDTLYWVERAGSGCLNAQRLLRKAWPTNPTERRIYQVQTIDTLDGSSASNYYDIQFSPVPSPGFYMNATRGSDRLMLWYDLQTRRRDTILACLASSCCDYDLSDYVQPSAPTFPYVVLRGGAIIYRSGSSELRAIIPVANIFMWGDTLRAESPISASSASYYSQDTLYLVLSTDSTRLSIGTCGGSWLGKSFWYGRYEFPGFTALNIVAPDTVCEGMWFSSFIDRRDFPMEEGCVVGGRLGTIDRAVGKVTLALTHQRDFHQWQANAQGHDTLFLTLSRWRWLFYSVKDRHPIRIRRGHRVRLRAALEGPWASQSGREQWMRPHPFLNRHNIGYYNERTSGVTADSLWKLPRPKGDSLARMWNLSLLDPPSGGCPSPNTWWCNPNWSQIALVELYDATTGMRVDSTYGLIDTVGRIFFYRAPLGDQYNGDVLHFCHCDTTPPKYLVVRTPNHLPLYTPSLSLPGRGAGVADSLDLTDPSALRGIPNIHYTLLADSSVSPPRMRAAAWTGNCADQFNAFIPGPHHDAGVVNAADWEFLIPRNGVTTGFSWADLDSDGVVNATDALILLLQNQNGLRESVGP
ncbi:MAG: hypothetical protein N3E49_04835 [Bacteroidia bacterium]|nr:hypothetical protein [Bacteroidia bacterium]